MMIVLLIHFRTTAYFGLSFILKSSKTIRFDHNLFVGGNNLGTYT